jgi:hypothetical protein
MDQQKIIHLAGETIVVGGLFLYLLRQIKSLQNEVSEIKETIIKQQQFIDKNFMAVSKTIDFLSLKHKSIERNAPTFSNQRAQSRPIKTKLNAVPLSDDDDKLNELMFPQNTGTIFVQTIRQPSSLRSLHDRDEHSSSKSVQENTDIVVVDDESDKNETANDLDDVEDISEELSQIQSSEEAFSNLVDEVPAEIKTEEEQNFQISEESGLDKKSKRRKANLKTKK